jgi:hypothetical protein
MAGLPPESDTVSGTPPESRRTSCQIASTDIGFHVSRYSLSTACSVSHQEQR